MHTASAFLLTVIKSTSREDKKKQYCWLVGASSKEAPGQFGCLLWLWHKHSVCNVALSLASRRPTQEPVMIASTMFMAVQAHSGMLLAVQSLRFGKSNENTSVI